VEVINPTVDSPNYRKTLQDYWTSLLAFVSTIDQLSSLNEEQTHIFRLALKSQWDNLREAQDKHRTWVLQSVERINKTTKEARGWQ
jgi:hypothetical protein